MANRLWTYQYAVPALYDNPPDSQKIAVFSVRLLLFQLLVGKTLFDPALSSAQISGVQ
jgi:hypothetical protein